MLARLIRSPALHFLVIGGLLFVANGWWQALTAVAPVPEALVVTSSKVEQICRDHIERNGVTPSPQQLQTSIADVIDEEILFREAVATGLDRGNAAVRQRLVQIARFIADEPDQDEEALVQSALQLGLDRSDLVVRRQLAMMMRLVAANTPLAGETPPGDEELEAYLRQHPDRFIEPWRVRLTHVYLSEDRRGAAAAAEALDLLANLRSAHIGPDDAPQLGDPFLRGHHLPWQTRQGLRQILGRAFSEAVAALQPSAWSDPIRSSYGWHLVWAHAVRPATIPALAAVRDRVRNAMREERREWRVRETLKALRARYSIQVESPATAGTKPTSCNSGG